jgi:hypothetical protein
MLVEAFFGSKDQSIVCSVLVSDIEWVAREAFVICDTLAIGRPCHVDDVFTEQVVHDAT